MSAHLNLYRLFLESKYLFNCKIVGHKPVFGSCFVLAYLQASFKLYAVDTESVPIREADLCIQKYTRVSSSLVESPKKPSTQMTKLVVSVIIRRISTVPGSYDEHRHYHRAIFSQEISLYPALIQWSTPHRRDTVSHQHKIREDEKEGLRLVLHLPGREATVVLDATRRPYANKFTAMRTPENHPALTSARLKEELVRPVQTISHSAQVPKVLGQSEKIG